MRRRGGNKNVWLGGRGGNYGGIARLIPCYKWGRVVQDLSLAERWHQKQTSSCYKRDRYRAHSHSPPLPPPSPIAPNSPHSALPTTSTPHHSTASSKTPHPKLSNYSPTPFPSPPQNRTKLTSPKLHPSISPPLSLSLSQLNSKNTKQKKGHPTSTPQHPQRTQISNLNPQSPKSTTRSLSQKKTRFAKQKKSKKFHTSKKKPGLKNKQTYLTLPIHSTQKIQKSLPPQPPISTNASPYPRNRGHLPTYPPTQSTHLKTPPSNPPKNHRKTNPALFTTLPTYLPTIRERLPEASKPKSSVSRSYE